MVSVVRRTVLMAASFAVGAMLAGPVLAQQKITVGAYPSNPPWEFKNEKGEFEGFEIDLIKEIGKRLGSTGRVLGHGLPGAVRRHELQPHRCRGVVHHDHPERLKPVLHAALL